MAIPDSAIGWQTPEVVDAGLTWVWRIALSDLAPPTWTLKYSFARGDGQPLIVTGTNGGDGAHLVTVPAVDSAKMPIGIVQWLSWAESGSDKVAVARGSITVRANVVSASGDPRSHVRRTLDALEAMLEGKASRDQASYSINGLSLSRMTIEELQRWHQWYTQRWADEVARDRQAAGAASRSTLSARFTRAS